MRESTPARAALAASIAFLVLLAASCGDEKAVAPCPVYDVAAFEGRVLAGGTGVAANVGARVATGANRGHVLFVTRSDSTGRYRLPVPAGSYYLEVNTDSGPSASRWPGLGDTFVVKTGIRQVDLRCARVEVRVEVPAAMEGREIPALLRCPRMTSLDASAVVRNGILEYRFQPVQENQAKLALGSAWYWDGLYWYPGTNDPDSAQSITLPNDRPLLLQARLDRWAAITGALRGPGMEYGYVSAYAAVDSSLAGFTSTGDGEFVLDVFLARPVKLLVESGEVAQWIGGGTFASAQLFDLHPGEIVRDVTVSAGSVRCVLEGPGNLIGHRGVAVLRDESGGDHACGFWSGSPVSLPNLLPGRYRLYVSGIGADQSWGSQWYDGATALAGAAPLEVREGEITRVTLHLSPGGSIEGRVLGSDGAGVLGGAVQLTDADWASTATYWIQHRDAGRFRFDGVGDGAYRLAAEIEGAAWWYPGTADADSAAVIEMIDHAAVTGIEWRLP